jgi:hypothetical protein
MWANERKSNQMATLKDMYKKQLKLMQLYANTQKRNFVLVDKGSVTAICSQESANKDAKILFCIEPEKFIQK